MPLESNQAESEVVETENRFGNLRPGNSRNRSINMKRTGVLWKRSVGEKELTLVDQRGARTYSAAASVLVDLKSNKIVDGTFVEVKVRRNVIETLNPVVFEGKVKKFKYAKTYAFLETPILPQVKLKGDCKRAVADCRIVPNPPKPLASIWFNPTSLHFPVVNEQLVRFCVAVTLRKIKRTRNPPYLDVHAIKIKPVLDSEKSGSPHSPVRYEEVLEAHQSPEKPSMSSAVPTNPEASLRSWMDTRMGPNITEKLEKPLYEPKPAPKVPRKIRSNIPRSKSASDIKNRISNSFVPFTTALQKRIQEQAQLKEKRNQSRQNRRHWSGSKTREYQTSFSRSPERFHNAANRSKAIPRNNYPKPVNRQNILPSVPPCQSAPSSSIWVPPSEQMSMLQMSPIAQEEKPQIPFIEDEVPVFPGRGLKMSLSTNDLPSRFEPPYYHSTPEIWDKRSGGTSQMSTEANLTSIASRTSPALSWMDGGMPLYGPATIAPMKTRSLISNWSSMPDLTRAQEEQSLPESVYGQAERLGMWRANSAPRLCALEENYRAKFQARDLDGENALFEDLGRGHHAG